MLYIRNPPLKSFRIDFKFSKPETISFQMMHEIDELLKKDYPIAPNIEIIQYPFDVPLRVNIPIQIGPVQFLNKDKTSQIQFFSDGLIFIFTEYSSWNGIKDSITDKLIKICEILNIGKIDHFRMEY
ncbi:MAG: hypothetical protein ACTSVI_17450, partial [Promethearchaeota archaeon]